MRYLLRRVAVIGVCCAACLGLVAVPASYAVNIYGLTSTNGLIRFDSASPGTVTTIGTISQAGIVDIDFYPANGLLYGMTANGTAYRINTTTAVATGATPASATFTAGAVGTVTDFDFNPGADRMRVFTNGSTNQNYRVEPDIVTAPQTSVAPGTVTTDGAFTGVAGFVPVANAYINNFDGAASTTLYSINTTNDSLAIHSVGPQFNTVATVGTTLGVTIGSNVGFDVGQNGIAYLSNDNSLFTVDLVTGVATSAGTVGGTGLVSIAVTASPVPEPGVVGLGVAAALCGIVGYARRKK
ncbi:MAG: DUF4394 domain-containing protein [Pirellulales bacterium]